MGVRGGGVEKIRLKLTSAKVEVEVEAELGKCKKQAGAELGQAQPKLGLKCNEDILH